MEIVIDTSNTQPVFAQIIDQIKKAILNDALSPGTPLPSIRQLANDLELNHNTVAKAYKLLERDSVIQTRGYRGTFVHPDAKTNSEIDLKDLAESKLSRVVGELRESGVTDSEIRVVFSNVMKGRE